MGCRHRVDAAGRGRESRSSAVQPTRALTGSHAADQAPGMGADKTRRSTLPRPRTGLHASGGINPMSTATTCLRLEPLCKHPGRPTEPQDAVGPTVNRFPRAVLDQESGAVGAGSLVRLCELAEDDLHFLKPPLMSDLPRQGAARGGMGRTTAFQVDGMTPVLPCCAQFVGRSTRSGNGAAKAA